MTASPLLPPGAAGRLAGDAADAIGEAEATSAELDQMVSLARDRGARVVAIGTGRTAAAARGAARFARCWVETGGTMTCVVTWPESAASWLRQARRFAAADPDVWIMMGPAIGWAQLTRRLLWSTGWQPERTVACAAIGSEAVIGLVGAAHLSGLTGATTDGGCWAVSDETLRVR